MSKYLNSREAAEIIGVSHETLRFWRYTGKFLDKIPPQRHVSRRVFYKRTDVENFVETMYCPAV